MRMMHSSSTLLLRCRPFRVGPGGSRAACTKQPEPLRYRCATAGAPMLPTAAPHRPRPVRSSRAPLVCLEHHKRASSTVRVASKWRWPESDMQSLRLLQEAAASTSGRLPVDMAMAAASAKQQQLLWLPSNGRCLQPRSSLPRPIGVCRGRACANQQPSHVISSCPHVVHVAQVLRCRPQQPCIGLVRLRSSRGAESDMQSLR